MDTASRIGDVLTGGDVEFPIVPRASHDLPVAHPPQPIRLVGGRCVGAADQTQAQGGALVRAIVHDRVQRTAHVVHADTELPDVDQFHPAGRQLVNGAHESPFEHQGISLLDQH